jgi:hypothetical protein
VDFWCLALVVPAAEIVVCLFLALELQRQAVEDSFLFLLEVGPAAQVEV